MRTRQMKIILTITILLLLVGCGKPNNRKIKSSPSSGKKQTTLDMKLDDTRTIGMWYVIKVPGGWVYNRYGREHIVFVKDERTNVSLSKGL